MLGKIRKAAVGLTFPLGRRALVSGVGAAIEHDKILKEPWRTIVDIGANRGQFTLAALRIRPETIIHAYEPLQGPGCSMEELFRGAGNVRVHRVAVGPERGKQTIHVTEKDDSSSLLPVGDAQSEIFGSNEVGSWEIFVERLDDRLKPADIDGPALLKLDVQGFELQALQGCETLLHCFDAVYVECSFVELYKGQALIGEVSGWLHARGFDLADIATLHRHEQRPIQGDFLFRRRVH